MTHIKFNQGQFSWTIPIAKQNDRRRFSQLPHRDRTASRVHTRTRRVVVGREGRLDASTRIRSAGRRRRGIMGSRLSSSERGRPEQCRLLVQPRRQARLPRTTRCGVAEHRNSFAEIVTAAVTIRVITASFDQMGALGRASGKRSSVRLLSFLLHVPQMPIGAEQLRKKLHILQKLSSLTTQTTPLTSFCLVRDSCEYVRLPRISLTSPTAADHCCGDAMTSGEPARCVVFRMRCTFAHQSTLKLKQKYEEK